METKIHLFVFCITTLMFGGFRCKKDDPIKPITYVPIDTTFLSYCAFPQGSWWVYNEKTSGAKDSIYVSYYLTEPFEDKKENLNYYRLIYHTETKTDSFYYFARPWQYPNQYIYILTENYSASFDATRFFYPFTTYNSLNNILYIQNIIDTLSINNILYKNIVVMNNTTSQYQNKIKTEYYCKNVGVIRKEMFNGEIWELKNYHINK